MAENYFMNQKIWQDFAHKYNLSPEQIQQFQEYYKLLIAWNKKINLTAITEESEVLTYHLEDSLHLSRCYDIKSTHMLADIGTGAGLPGIPLKIVFPHIAIVLVEVIQKKVIFLREVIQELGLQNIEVVDMDWRTFLRKTAYPVDLICARASLRPDELTRMFQQSSAYKNARLIYWASVGYEIGSKEAPFFERSCDYAVGDKTRSYYFFARK